MITDCPRAPLPRPIVRKKELRVMLPALPPKDPFACLSAESAPTARLKPACPGKRVVVSATRSPDSQSRNLHFSFKPLPQMSSKSNLPLAPIKVKHRLPHLLKSNSLQNLSHTRPHTPCFRRGEMMSVQASPCSTDREIEKKPGRLLLSQFGPRSVEVSFGRVI